MKLRQKLAMVLAAAMVVTAVPVTTMASSTNKYNRTISAKKDAYVNTATDLALNIKIDGTVPSTGEVFYVSSTDFKFVEYDAAKKEDVQIGNFSVVDDKNTADEADDVTLVEVEVLSKTALRVKTYVADFQLPVLGKVTGEVPTIVVDGEGSIVSSGKYPIMGADVTVTDKSLTATVGDTTSISVDGVGKLADITIDEVVANQINDKIVKIELDNSDLEFTYTKGAKLAFEGKRGFAGQEKGTVVDGKDQNTGDADTYVEVVDVDGDTLQVKFVGFPTNDKGGVILKGLKVNSAVRGDVSTGDVEATISLLKAVNGDVDTKAMSEVTVKVAEVSEFDVKLTVKDDKAVEFVAGGEAKEVEFTLKEAAAGSLDDNDRVFFEVEGAKVVKIGDKKVDDTWNSKTSFVEIADEKAKLTYDKDDKEFELDLANINEKAVSEYKIKVTLAVEPGKTDDVVVKATSKAFDDKEVTVGTVKEDRTIEVTPVKVTVGTKGQVGGSIVLKEDAKKTFRKGEQLFVALEEDAIDDGLKISDFEVEADDESGLEVKKVDAYYTMKVNPRNADEVIATTTLTTEKKTTIAGKEYDNEKATNVIAIEIKGESKEAGTITINELEINTKNSTPDGTYKATLTGKLVSKEGGKLEKDFVVVGEGTAKAVEIAEGPEVYLNEDNRMMAKLRVVSEAFGVEPTFQHNEEGVGVITFFRANGTPVQFTNGSNVMNMNGVAIPMDTKTVIKEDGYTYVPARYLAEALGLAVEWNETTRVATFTTK